MRTSNVWLSSEASAKAISILPLQVPLITSLQLGFLHATWLGQQLARTSLLKWYLAWTSAKLGKKYDSPESASLIQRFIQVISFTIPLFNHSDMDCKAAVCAFMNRQKKARCLCRPMAWTSQK